MSTFNGLVDEFPDIRIDYFRSHTGRRQPAACFLSHVHSDHLLGLESLKMPFVYCSSVTRSILLRIEKYPHRINFQRGILESRKQTYRHLGKVLRELPLEAPIELELRPNITIRVTLFDANHCPGAVMFLIEGSGKAIVYTGDIRAETWWVNSIVRNPVMLPYCSGRKTLDCIYLDTTFAAHDNIYRNFPSKADGLRELLDKIDKCPVDSIFYFRAWTLGYEDVWIALASHLRARVHVDDYQLQIHAAYSEQGGQHGAALVGAQVGNIIHAGCLSKDMNSGIHSCEPGMECHAELKTNPNIVWISPIVSRLSDGTEVAEVGAGGGPGDLGQTIELELADDASIHGLRAFCRSVCHDPTRMEHIEAILQNSTPSSSLNIALGELGLNQDEEIDLEDFVNLISIQHQTPRKPQATSNRHGMASTRIIRFPYARHSSLSELRDLVSRFKPKDLCPCTVDTKTWSEDASMQSLFGNLCSAEFFKYDAETRRQISSSRPGGISPELTRKRKREQFDSQETASQDSQQVVADVVAPVSDRSKDVDGYLAFDRHDLLDQKPSDVIVIDDDDENEIRTKDQCNVNDHGGSCESECNSDISLPREAFDSQQARAEKEIIGERCVSEERLSARRQAYRAAKSCLVNGDPSEWEGLHLRTCGWKGHTEEEIIL